MTGLAGPPWRRPWVWVALGLVVVVLVASGFWAVGALTANRAGPGLTSGTTPVPSTPGSGGAAATAAPTPGSPAKSAATPSASPTTLDGRASGDPSTVSGDSGATRTASSGTAGLAPGDTAASGSGANGSEGDSGTGGSSAPTQSPAPPQPSDGTLPAGSTHTMYDAQGNVAMPMPRLAHETTVTINADDTTEVSFGFGYDVANDASIQNVRADEAVLHVMVSTTLGASGGPLRSMTPLFSQTLIESNLNAPHVARDYRVMLPANVTEFLRSKGLGSADPAAVKRALVYIDLDVQQMRDFKKVDGKWDWAQGRAYTAADLPVQTSGLSDSSTITVTNDTGSGVYETDALGTQSNQLTSNGSYAAPISLSGQAVQCIDQGHGSDPQGFALVNGWDIEEGLPPGTLPPGASMTETVAADDQLGAPTEDILEDTGDATVQAEGAVMGYTTPGIKSAGQQAYMLSMGLADLTVAETAAFGVPIKAIVELGFAIDHAATQTCADYANIFNLTAVEPSGSQASYSWGDQTNGLQQTYDSATYGGNAVTNNVALAASTGVISGAYAGTDYSFNPYLHQYAASACGDASSCSGNVIDIRWSANNPCPYSDLSNCAVTASEIASPQLSVPGTSLCGVDNALCPPIAAPIPSASNVPVTADIAGTEGSPYGVLEQWQPPHPITGMAVDDAGDVFTGDATGTVTKRTPEKYATTYSFSSSPVTSMTTLNGTVYVTNQSGGLWVYDASADRFTELVQYPNVSIDHLTAGGAGLYFAEGDNGLEVYDPATTDGYQLFDGDSWGALNSVVGGSSITAMTSDGTNLVVGFSSGYIARCSLSDCSTTMAVIDSPGTLEPAASFAVQALAISGGTFYAGASDGSMFQVDITDGASKVMIGTGQYSAQLAGMGIADGVLYAGGCEGIQNPITGNMLGVFTATDVNGIDSTFGLPQGGDPAQFNSCANPSNPASHYKGFDPTSYQLVVSKPSPSLPSIVYVALAIDTGNFVYALQNASVPTTNICASNCPADTDPSTYVTSISTTPQPPSPSLQTLGSPQTTSTCGGAAYGSTATGDLGTAPPSSLTIGTGMRLQAAASPDQACTTQFTWNLNDVGSLPYAYWSANAYLDSVSAPGVDAQLYASAGSSTKPGPNGSLIFAPTFVPSTPAELTQTYPALYNSGGTNWHTPPSTTAVTGVGTQLAVALAGQPMLSLSITVAAGQSTPIVVDLANDVLTPVGSPPPTLVPLTGASPACIQLDQSAVGSDGVIYPLNDSGAIVNDVSGNAFNGLSYSPAALNQQSGPNLTCPSSGALAFDGSSTFVDAQTAPNAFTQGGALTVMGWFELPANSAVGTHDIVMNDVPSATHNGFALIVNGSASGIDSGSFSVGTSAGATTLDWSTVAPLAAGVWHQYAGVYDGARLIVYLDGRPVNYVDGVSGQVLPGADDVTLGYNASSHDEYFAGSLADVVVASKALNPSTIASLYENASGQTESPPAPAMAPVAEPCSIANSSLVGAAVALYPMNDSNSPLLDWSGHGNVATVTGGASADFDQTPGPYLGCPADGSLDFNNVTPADVTMPAAVSTALASNAFSYVTWFNPQTAGGGSLFSNGELQGTTTGLNIQTVDGEVEAILAYGQQQTLTVQAPLANVAGWNHVVVTFDGSILTLYLDGRVVGTASTGSAVTPLLGSQPPMIAHGMNEVANGETYVTGLNGQVADTAVVARTLSAADVAGLYAYSGRP